VWSAGPVRVYLVTFLVWVEGRYGFFLGSCFGGYGTCEQVGVAGQYGFSSPWLCFGGYGTIEISGLCCDFLLIFFSFLSLLLACGYAR
jgi:hypothetical protein